MRVIQQLIFSVFALILSSAVLAEGHNAKNHPPYRVELAETFAHIMDNMSKGDRASSSSSYQTAEKYFLKSSTGIDNAITLLENWPNTNEREIANNATEYFKGMKYLVNSHAELNKYYYIGQLSNDPGVRILVQRANEQITQANFELEDLRNQGNGINVFMRLTSGKWSNS